MNFNTQQIMTFVGLLLAVIGTALTSFGVLTNEAWLGLNKAIQDTVTALVALIGFVITIVQQRKAAQALAAASIDGVQVHVNTKVAPSSVAILAETDTPEATDIVPMSGGPGGIAKPVKKEHV